MEKCCHPNALLLCPHPCRACLLDKAGQVADGIARFERKSARDEETDTGAALELLADARRTLKKFVKEGR